MRAAAAAVVRGLVGLGAVHVAETGVMAQSGTDFDSPHARARLISEEGAFVPGAVAMVGVTFDIDPGWHLYWNGVNDTGFPITIDLTLPDGYRAMETLWPAPHRHVSEGEILDHIYEDRVTLLIPVVVPEGAAAGTSVTIKAGLEWLECAEGCIPGAAEVELVVPVVGTRSEALPSAEAARFKEARARLPKELPAPSRDVTWQWRGDTLTVRGAGAAGMWFYPRTGSAALAAPIADGATKGDRLALRLEPEQDPETPLMGVLEIKPATGGGPALYSVSIPRAGPVSETRGERR